jgi:hypothetical protein
MVEMKSRTSFGSAIHGAILPPFDKAQRKNVTIDALDFGTSQNSAFSRA